ncbi:hypothetical protein M9458_050192, partial [Cirrhinus mrigala]
GLALINGTQMITSLGAEAVERAEAIARQADIIAALTLEPLIVVSLCKQVIDVLDANRRV